MSNKPIVISIRKYSAYNHIRNSVIKHHLPSSNYYEILCIDSALNISLYNKYGSPVSSPRIIPKYNGDLWIFSRGFSDEKKVFPKEYRSGMFFSFDDKKSTGLLFNNFILYGLIHTYFQPKRLFLFSCYQGGYLENYLNGIPTLEEVHGIKSSVDILKANEELNKYFKDIDSYRMEEVLAK